jgi:hypothetical protein
MIINNITLFKIKTMARYKCNNKDCANYSKVDIVPVERVKVINGSLVGANQYCPICNSFRESIVEPTDFKGVNVNFKSLKITVKAKQTIV